MGLVTVCINERRYLGERYKAAERLLTDYKDHRGHVCMRSGGLLSHNLHLFSFGMLRRLKSRTSVRANCDPPQLGQHCYFEFEKAISKRLCYASQQPNKIRDLVVTTVLLIPTASSPSDIIRSSVTITMGDIVGKSASRLASTNCRKSTGREPSIYLKRLMSDCATMHVAAYH